MGTSNTRLVTGVSGRYAIALFELVQAEKSSEKLMVNLRVLRESLTPELSTFLKNPVLEKDQAEAVLSGVATHLKLPLLLTNFLKLVARKGRADCLVAILDDVKRLEDQKNGVVQARVLTATKLTKTQEKDVEKIVKKMAPYAKKVEMTVGVDKTLVAGTKIQVGDQAIDNSIAGRMSSLAGRLRHQALSDV